MKYDIETQLHPDTKDLVACFSIALERSLYEAQKKYGYTNGWADTDWLDKCRADLSEHVKKGDPLDVAAYCAFLWYHGESTSDTAAAIDAYAKASQELGQDL